MLRAVKRVLKRTHFGRWNVPELEACPYPVIAVERGRSLNLDPHRALVLHAAVDQLPE